MFMLIIQQQKKDLQYDPLRVYPASHSVIAGFSVNVSSLIWKVYLSRLSHKHGSGFQCGCKASEGGYDVGGGGQQNNMDGLE